MSLMTWSCFAALYNRLKLQQYAAPTVPLLAASNFTQTHQLISFCEFAMKCVQGINYVYGHGPQSYKLQK